jgi:hypothetical protein
MTQVNEGSDTSTDGAAAPATAEKQCPECLQLSPHDATHCWLCGFNFETNSAPSRDEPEKQSGQQVVQERRAPGTADAALQATPQAVAIITTTGDNLFHANLGASSIAGGAETVKHHEIGGAEDDIFAVDLTTPSSENVAAPLTSEAIRNDSGKVSGVEPSAISIPFMDLIHPLGPHVVIVLDLESRKDRPASESAPPSREPVLIELTGEAHPFGKLIKSFWVGFDPYASSMHGFFVKNANGPGYMLRDLSTNGTKLNGRFISKGEDTLLRDGDVITFGAWSKLIYYAGATIIGAS